MLTIPKSTAPRAIVGKTLNGLIEKNKKIVVIDNDLASSTSTYDVFKAFPEHFWELGIAEQSALSAATGLALDGCVPFYVNFAILATGTVWTQIRQACYAKANLKIIGTHPGLDAGPDGASHQATQDLAIMRPLPNLSILMPCDENDVRGAIAYAESHPGMFYVRVSREPVPMIYNSPAEAAFDTTCKEVASTGKDAVIFFDGVTLEQGMAALNLLEEHKIGATLVHVRSLKPLDTEGILKFAKGRRCAITLENHSVIGGLGSAVAEVLAAEKDACPLGIVGAKDTFGESGVSVLLKEKYGVSAKAVLEKVKTLL